MAEKIIETLNQIADAKGEKYAQVLVEGINIGALLASVPKEDGKKEKPGA